MSMDQINYRVTHSGVQCKALEGTTNTVKCEDIGEKDLDNVVVKIVSMFNLN